MGEGRGPLKYLEEGRCRIVGKGRVLEAATAFPNDPGHNSDGRRGWLCELSLQ